MQKAEPRGAANRQLKNFLLLPQIQIRLGAYMIVLAGAFLAGGGALVYLRLESLFYLILDLTELESEVLQMLIQEFRALGVLLALLTCAYVWLNLMMSIVFTHRMIGPIQAFRRHVNQLIAGNYQVTTQLRPRDAFKELASDLNRLSTHLRDHVSS